MPDSMLCFGCVCMSILKDGRYGINYTSCDSWGELDLSLTGDLGP